jgi:dTDP-glucose pyrophosphorylase
MYLEDDPLNVELLGRGFAWLDRGTHESLYEASFYCTVIISVYIHVSNGACVRFTPERQNLLAEVDKALGDWGGGLLPI